MPAHHCKWNPWIACPKAQALATVFTRRPGRSPSRKSSGFQRRHRLARTSWTFRRSPLRRRGCRNPLQRRACQNPHLRRAGRNPYPGQARLNPPPGQVHQDPCPRQARRNPIWRQAHRNPYPRQARRNPISRQAHRHPCPPHARQNAPPQQARRNPLPQQACRNPTSRQARQNPLLRRACRKRRFALVHRPDLCPAQGPRRFAQPSRHLAVAHGPRGPSSACCLCWSWSRRRHFATGANSYC